MAATLGASLLGNLLAGKRIVRGGDRVIQAGEGVLELLKGMTSNAPYLLTNFETQKYYQKKPSFNSVYSRNNLPKIKDGTYVINLDEFKSIGTHWIALYVNGDNLVASKEAIHFDIFGVEHILKENKKFISNINIKTNIFRLQAYDSVMCGYFCIRFTDFMLKGKSLLEYNNLFLPNNYEKNDKITLKYFQ